MKLSKFILPAAACLSLSGCIVAAAADLAATTVFTAGKLAVKGTGALIDAAIPDGDAEDKKEKQPKINQEKARQTQSAGNRSVSTPPVYGTPGYASPKHRIADEGTNSPGSAAHTAAPRYINVPPGGQTDATR